MWNWLMMGPWWLTLSLGCCLSLSHLSSESPAAVNPLEITASSSSFCSGTFPSTLTLQKKEINMCEPRSWWEHSRTRWGGASHASTRVTLWSRGSQPPRLSGLPEPLLCEITMWVNPACPRSPPEARVSSLHQHSSAPPEAGPQRADPPASPKIDAPPSRSIS